MDDPEKSIRPVSPASGGFVLVFVIVLVLVGLMLGVGRLAREQAVRQQAVEYQKSFGRELELYREAAKAAANTLSPIQLLTNTATSFSTNVPSWFDEPFGLRFEFSPARDANHWLDIVISGGSSEAAWNLSMTNNEVRAVLYPQADASVVQLDTNNPWSVELDNLRVTISNHNSRSYIPLSHEAITSAADNVSGIFTHMVINQSMNITASVHRGYHAIAASVFSNRLAGQTNWSLHTNRLYVKRVAGGFLISE